MGTIGQLRANLRDTLEQRTWLWYLPLVWLATPAWLAWNHSFLVPHADQWFVSITPYLNMLNGSGSLWDFIHAPGNDSRHDVPHLFNWIVFRFFGGDLRVESLVCVAFAGMTAAMLVWLLRRRLDGPILWRYLLAWLAVGHVLSPFQWMNWAWGVQICYAVVVWGSIAALTAMQTQWPLVWRTAAASTAAIAATLSFLNGWLAWVLIALMLAVEAWRSSWRRPSWWCSFGLLAVFFSATVWYFFLEWPQTKTAEESAMIHALIARPLTYGLFFLRVIAAPFSEILLTTEKDLRAEGIWAVSPWLGGCVLGLWLMTLAAIWRKRLTLDWQKITPWLLCGVFGFGNALALTFARTGHAYAIPFECRYPAYTIWLHIGVLALAGHLTLRWQKAFYCLWVAAAVTWGGIVGGIQGFRDSERIHEWGSVMEAAVSLRKVAVEPVPIDGVAPTGGERNIVWLDDLEAHDLLGVPTITSSLVSEAKVQNLGGIWEGALKEGKVEPGAVTLRGWALRRKTRIAAPAVAISIQRPGEPERWLGLATRRLREVKLAESKKARVLQHRIGWSYEPLTGQETCQFTNIPLNLKRQPLAAGAATFRAYVFDVPSSTFWRLPGEQILTLP